MRDILAHTAALVLLLPCLAPSISSAQDGEPDGRIESIRVGIYHYPPLLFVDDEGKASGFYVDIVNEVARRESWTVDYVFGTWDECLARLEAEEIDILLSIAYTEERAKKYAYINETVFTNWGQVYVHKSQEVRSIFDMKGLRVSVLSNDVYSYGPQGFIQIARKLDMDYQLVVEAQYDGVIDAIQEGRADAGIASRGYQVDLEKYTDVRLSPVVMSPVEIRFALPNKGPLTSRLIPIFDRHISQLKKDPDSVYHRSIEKHVGMQTKIRVVPDWIWYSLSAAAVLLLFFVFSYFLAKWQVQKKTRELQASEGRYRTLVEHAPEAILVLDTDTGTFTDANDVASQLFGRPRDALLAMTIRDISPLRQPGGKDSAELFRDRLVEALAGQDPAFEWMHLDRDGREFHAEVRLVRLPSEERRLVRASISDISERKNLEAQIRHQDKIAAVGTLAAGVAHEIGNPLLAISLAAQGLQRKAQKDYTKKKLGLITSHINRISKIVQHMSDLARPPSEEQARCDLHGIIERALEIARYDRRAKEVDIVTDFSESLPPVLCVADQLVQVFINLALNAVDALSDHQADREKRITVSTTRLAGEGAGTIRILVRDTGSGIRADDLEKVFQPFFTTKEVGKGTGLGLAVSHRIVEEHGGTIRVESEPDQGSCFIIDLPAGG